MIMEEGKSQDMQSELASWKPRRADGSVLVQRLASRNPGRANVSVRVWGQEKKKKLMSQFAGSQAGKNSFLLREGSDFLFYSGLQMIGWGPSILEGSNLLCSVCQFKCNLMQKYPHRNTRNKVWPDTWFCGLVNLT